MRQIKAMMATLEVVSGEQADDPLYVLLIDPVLGCLERQGLLIVGDCMMRALATRAHLKAQQYYLTPMALVSETAQLLLASIEAGLKQGDDLTALLSEDGKQSMAQGYELSRRCVGGALSWQERVRVVRQQAYADMQDRHLEEGLVKAQAALWALTPTLGRGNRQIGEQAILQSAAQAVLARHQVKLVGRGRAGANRPPPQVIEWVSATKRSSLN